MQSIFFVLLKKKNFQRGKKNPRTSLDMAGASEGDNKSPNFFLFLAEDEDCLHFVCRVLGYR